MAYEGNQPVLFSAIADGDLSDFQFHLVEMTGDDKVGITTVLNNKVAGVLQNKPEDKRHAKVCPLGISKVRFGVACTYGDKVSVADSGWAGVTTNSLSTNGFVIHGCASGGIATCFINMANAVSLIS